MVKSMNETFGMFGQRSLLDLPNVISSPESELGPTPCVVPVGPMIDPAGLAPALASLSARAAKEKGLLTSGTYGRRGSISSASADLQWSMASRLREVTAKLGSTLFRLIWKEKVTQSHRLIYRLRASARRTSGSDCTSWPTPKTPTGGPESAERKQELGRTESGGGDLQAVAQMAAWPTPQSHDERERGNTEADHHYFPHDLSNAAKMAAWCSPSVADGTGGHLSRGGNRRNEPLLPGQAKLASWATPRSTDGQKGGPNQHGSKGDLMLPSQAARASWATPAGRDFRDGRASQKTMEKNARPLNEQAVQLTASGPTPNGSTAETRNTGQLNPSLSRYLQGLPVEWDLAATRVEKKPSRRK